MLIIIANLDNISRTSWCNIRELSAENMGDCGLNNSVETQLTYLPIDMNFMAMWRKM